MIKKPPTATAVRLRTDEEMDLTFHPHTDEEWRDKIRVLRNEVMDLMDLEERERHNVYAYPRFRRLTDWVFSRVRSIWEVIRGGGLVTF